VDSDESDSHEPRASKDGQPADVESDQRGGRRRRRAKVKTAHSRWRTVIETAIGLAIALLIALGFRAFVFQAYFVPSGSMEPTLQPGDRILVDKFDFNYHSIHAGDIIVFRTPPAALRDCATEDGDLVKRVVATGGETIWSKGDTVLIKNKKGLSSPLQESYFPHDGRTTPLGQPITRYTVPTNDFYVLGDNRAVSCDSRVWGAVPGSDIVGRVVAVVWRGWHPDLIIF
jgi:signal peptidase I